MSVEQSTFSKWFRGEVGAAFAVGCFVAGIVIWFTTPVTDLKINQATMLANLDTIKNNDIVHIELEIAKIEANQAAQADNMKDMNDKLIQVLTILKQK